MREKPITPIIFVLVLLIAAGSVLLNYNALLDADSYTYLIYARDLARGSLFGEAGIYRIFKDYWPLHHQVDLHSACRHMVDGRIYHGIEVGYPLLLAFPMVLFGPSAVYFINPVLLLILILVFYSSIRLIFSRKIGDRGLALLSVLLLLLLPPDRVISSSTKIMRDIPPLVFLLISFYCLLRFSATERTFSRRTWIFFGAFFLGMGAMIRFHYLIMVCPFFLFLFASLRARGQLLRRGLPFLLFALLGLACFTVPVLIRDLLIQGNPFHTAGILADYLLVVSAPSKLFASEYFRRSGLWYFDYLTRVYDPSLIFMAVVGLVAGIKLRPIRFLLLPAALLHFFIFAFFRYHHSRYLLPLYPVVSCLTAYGIFVCLDHVLALYSRTSSIRFSSRAGWITGILVIIYLAVSRLERLAPLFSPQTATVLIFGAVLLVGPKAPGWGLTRRRLITALNVLLTGLLAAGLIPTILHPYSFNLSDARRLKTEVGKYVPPGSLILASRYLKQNLDYYTDSYSLNIFQPGAPWGLSMEDSLTMIMDSGAAVFVFDNKGKRKASKFLPALRQYFSLEPVTRWKSEDLGLRLRYLSENEYLNLYRVIPWREKEVEVSLEVADPRVRYLLILGAGRVWSDRKRKRIEVFCDGSRLRGELKDGVNYILLPPQLLQSSPPVVTLVSDRGLPADPAIRYLGKLNRGFRIDIGEKAYREKPGGFDWRFLGPGFFNRFGAPHFRTIVDKGRIRVPAFRVHEKDCRARIRLRNNLGKLSPLRVRFSIEDENVFVWDLGAESGWSEIEIPLPSGFGKIGTAWLDLEASPLSPSGRVDEARRRSGTLSVDWIDFTWKTGDENNRKDSER